MLKWIKCGELGTSGVSRNNSGNGSISGVSRKTPETVSHGVLPYLKPVRRGVSGVSLIYRENSGNSGNTAHRSIRHRPGRQAQVRRFIVRDIVVSIIPRMERGYHRPRPCGPSGTGTWHRGRRIMTPPTKRQPADDPDGAAKFFSLEKIRNSRKSCENRHFTRVFPRQ